MTLPFKRQFHKMAKHTQTIRRQIAWVTKFNQQCLAPIGNGGGGVHLPARIFGEK